ncbi:hypothetical protein JA1_000294 [Spathaspora sp. JA1]|nr:hypothetical protein JA1_000294 [Spathaspora sp. JA1]
MKAIIPFTLFSTILAASNSSMLTISSTIISTLPCSSTTLLYSNSSTTSPATTTQESTYNNDTLLSTSLKQAVVTSEDPTEIETETDTPSTTSNDPAVVTKSETYSTLVTITSCSNGDCTLATETAAYVTNVSGGTTFTSLLPGNSNSQPTTSTTTNFYTTVVTEYSCQQDSCTAISKTTGVTVITHSDTVYTTFCPLSSESHTPRSTQIPTTTVNVITSNIITESNSPAIQTFVPESATTAAPQVATYEPIYDGGVSTNKISTVLSAVMFLLLLW